MRIRLLIDIDPRTRTYDAGLLVLSRHAGLGDSPLIAYVLTHHLRREPRVLLKRFLLWDAAVDLVLTRLDAHFLPSRRVDREESSRRLVEFAQSIDADDDALLLFPEGRNWTPARWEAQLAQASDDEARWMRQHPSVLPPRSGGLRRLLAARPGLPLVVAAHRGLEGFNSVRTIWQGVPLDGTVEVRLRMHPAPPDDQTHQWLHDRWGEIDAWDRAAQRSTSPS
nr:1-acyl-sn-glycerol-3-phosphate acyltransferase [Flexivirga aerilata]